MSHSGGPEDGDLRYVAATNQVEQFNGTGWAPIPPGSDVAELRVVAPGGGGGGSYIIRPGTVWPEFSNDEIDAIVARAISTEAAKREERDDDAERRQGGRAD